MNGLRERREEPCARHAMMGVVRVSFALGALLYLLGCNGAQDRINDLLSNVPARQIAAAARLRERPNPRTMDALRAALRSPNFEVRSAVALAIAATNDRAAKRDAARTLADDLLDGDPETAHEAAKVLGVLGGVALPDLVTAATLTQDLFKDIETKKAIKKALEASKPEDRRRASALLVSGLEETKPALYRASFNVLAFVARDMAPEIADAGLRHANPIVRRSVVIALGETGDAGMVKRILDALDDPNAEVRADAARALGRLGDPAAVDALRRHAASDTELQVQEAARQALAQIADAARTNE